MGMMEEHSRTLFAPDIIFFQANFRLSKKGFNIPALLTLSFLLLRQVSKKLGVLHLF